MIIFGRFAKDLKICQGLGKKNTESIRTFTRFSRPASSTIQWSHRITFFPMLIEYTSWGPEDGHCHEQEPYPMRKRQANWTAVAVLGKRSPVPKTLRIVTSSVYWFETNCTFAVGNVTFTLKMLVWPSETTTLLWNCWFGWANRPLYNRIVCFMVWNGPTVK